MADESGPQGAPVVQEQKAASEQQPPVAQGQPQTPAVKKEGTVSKILKGLGLLGVLAALAAGVWYIIDKGGDAE
jgi:hypothetical protein